MREGIDIMKKIQAPEKNSSLLNPCRIPRNYGVLKENLQWPLTVLS
jgi:hypothetical protein